jgi:hypothetical protein
MASDDSTATGCNGKTDSLDSRCGPLPMGDLHEKPKLMRFNAVVLRIHLKSLAQLTTGGIG